MATRILGFDEGELLSMKYFELMRPDWVPRAMSFYEKATKTRDSTYLEFPIRRKDGQEIWVGQHVRPILTSGQLEGFQGLARDITDRVNAQAELRAERDFKQGGGIRVASREGQGATFTLTVPLV